MGVASPLGHRRPLKPAVGAGGASAAQKGACRALSGAKEQTVATEVKSLATTLPLNVAPDSKPRSFLAKVTGVFFVDRLQQKLEACAHASRSQRLPVRGGFFFGLRLARDHS